jgi:excisionase family DNA binding protein
MKNWLTTGQAAQQFGISAKTLARYAKQGKLPSVATLGGRRRFDPATIQQLTHSLYQPATTWPTQKPTEAQRPSTDTLA